MFQEERFRQICMIVEQRQSVKVSELSETLNSSVATIRRDLEELQKQGRIVRTHGGAMPPYCVGYEIHVDQLQTKHIDEKQEIARVALSLVRNNDTLLIDESSTALSLAQLLSQSNLSALTIVTPSLKVVQTFSHTKGYQVVLVGGTINFEQSRTEGYAAVQFIRSMRVDKCFVGINGIDASFGLSTPRLSEAEMKTTMIESSRVSYVLADHTKFGKTYFAPIREPDFVVTDKRIDGIDYEQLQKRYELLYADEQEELL